MATLLFLTTTGQPKGNLFIIGGGDRSPQLIETLIATAHLSAKDYIVVLPMAGENEQGLRKIIDLTRFGSIFILLLHFYFYC